MQEVKRKYLTGVKLQGEFDRFAKKTIKYVIRNVLRDYIRNKDRIYEVSIEEMDELEAPDWISDYEKIPVLIGSTVFPFYDEQVADSFEHLKKRHREVIEKAYILDMPIEMIAELMDLEGKTIKNYLSEARGILKKYTRGMS